MDGGNTPQEGNLCGEDLCQFGSADCAGSSGKRDRHQRQRHVYRRGAAYRKKVALSAVRWHPRIPALCRYRNRIDRRRMLERRRTRFHAYLHRSSCAHSMQSTSRIGNQDVSSFLFSTLSCSTGKILLNTELGDFGKMEVKSCDCLFGRVGMNVHVSEVRSFDKLTGEGMTLLGSELG